MLIDKYAKGTIAFVPIIAVSHIWSAISRVYKEPWTPWPPIVPFMSAYVVPFLDHLYRPILIGLTGLVVLWVWEGRRAGYLIALLLAVLASGFALFVTFFNAMNQEWSGTFTAAVAIAFPAIMALWYSAQGYRQHGS